MPSREDNALECERYILGTLIMMPDERDKLFTSVKPEYFYSSDHRTVFETCILLHNNDIEFDIAVLTKELLSMGKCKNPHEVTEMACYYCTHSWITFSDELKRLYNLRYYENNLKYIMEFLLEEPNMTPEKITDKLYEIIETGSRNFCLSKIKSPDLNDIMQSYEDPVPASIPTGYKKLDGKIGGLRNGNLVVIGGRTGHGKTAMALNIAYNLALDNVKVGMLSLEMTDGEIYSRIISMETGIDLLDLNEKRLAEEDYKLISDKAAKLKTIFDNFQIFDGDVELNDSVFIIRSMVREKGCKVIIVDYLGLITNPEIKNNLYYEIKSITRRMKLLAKELNVPLILLSQLNRQSAVRNKPVLSDLRDSGSIEQDSDIVMFIYRQKDEVKDKTNLLIAKGRNVRTGEVKFKFIPQNTKFEET
jgi:replicative DNA helicase